MKLYDKFQNHCKYGEYDLSKPASYIVTDGKKLNGPWYYIYQNRKVLLYVDQNGPVKIQYQPPKGILIIKRDIGETSSKWQNWISSKNLNDGIPVSNFASPELSFKGEKPEFTVHWSPSVATYTSVYKGTTIKTDIFVPHDKATVCMKTTVTNTSDKKASYKLTPAILPYINKPNIVAWDLPEWYLSSEALINNNLFTIVGNMSDPDMIKENCRSVTINFDYDKNAQFSLALTDFAKTSNFFNPDFLKNGNLKYIMKDAESTVSFDSYQACYAVQYDFSLSPDESKTYTQVLTIQEDYQYNQQENDYDKLYFAQETYTQKIKDTDGFYNDLFSKRSVSTENKLFDNFINTFTPLEMYWVCSLDRGWPSMMRGTRDSSQDFNGMLPLDPEWTREIILETFEHQRTDGWFPRQISTVSRSAPHDMRYFSDGGAFFLELIYSYLCFTRDFSVLDEKIWWLDSDIKDTVQNHIIRTFDYYLSPINIGEHGICKVWYGDWWDVLDKIGMEGRGETVTVTAQVILALRYFSDVFIKVGKLKNDKKLIGLSDIYSKKREKFIENLNKYAYNKEGFYNGYFNDNGKWLFSDKDPDNESRLYMVANCWAIICGATNSEMTESVLDNIQKRNFAEVGYYTYSKGIKKYIDKAGRVGNGSRPEPSTYNHAQSFLVRACCSAGNPEMAYNATRYIFPFEEYYRPVEMTLAPPFAIANGYNTSKESLNRTELQYLSGSVSYVLRNVYSYIFGITYTLNGIILKPCLPKEYGDCKVTFSYLGKHFTVSYIQNGEKTVKFNGDTWSETSFSYEEHKNFPFIADEYFEEENFIEIFI